jgi:Kazal-type serine protease inhibitor domain
MIKYFVILTIVIASFGCSKDEACVEKIKENCVCTQQYEPVCGCNNKTYGNACEAACASIEVAHTGECKK